MTRAASGLIACFAGLAAACGGSSATPSAPDDDGAKEYERELERRRACEEAGESAWTWGTGCQATDQASLPWTPAETAYYGSQEALEQLLVADDAECETVATAFAAWVDEQEPYLMGYASDARKLDSQGEDDGPAVRDDQGLARARDRVQRLADRCAEHPGMPDPIRRWNAIVEQHPWL